jgi:sigma-B regulation protein RsbU (phosphoserine phosphatase)
MKKPLKVLIIEDSELDAMMLLGHLRHAGYDPQYRIVATAADLDDALNRQEWEIVLSDHNMPNFSSTAALERVRAANADIPFLIVSGSIGEEVAVEAMKAGAQDYLMKGNLARLEATVDRELKEAGERRARREAERSLLARGEELRIAREVQQQLFPATAPALPGCDLAGASCPAEETGGDYYDFIAGRDGEFFFVIGDVTGHGLGPALLMADVRAYLRALVLSNRSLGEIMAQARHLLVEDLGPDRFITILFAKFCPGSRTFSYINAGHPAGYLIAADGQVRAELGAGAAALGIDGERDHLVPVEVSLSEGDLILVLTDGILEATSPSGEEFGETRVLDVVRRERGKPSAEIIRILFDEVRRFKGSDKVQDDITAVILKMPG